MDLRELLSNPGTAAFSRLKYLPRFATDDELEEFINGLFLAVGNARYEGDWDVLNEYLEKWDEVGINYQFSSLALPDTGTVPWATLKKPLGQAKIALVTTGGVFVKGQKPYSERGQYDYREIPRDRGTRCVSLE